MFTAPENLCNIQTYPGYTTGNPGRCHLLESMLSSTPVCPLISGSWLVSDMLVHLTLISRAGC